jgi:hypothetical protein
MVVVGALIHLAEVAYREEIRTMMDVNAWHK